MDSFGYSPITVERSRSFYKLLVGRGRLGNWAPLTYGEASKALGFHVRAIKYPLVKLQDELKGKFPNLTVLIVDAEKKEAEGGMRSTRRPQRPRGDVQDQGDRLAT